MTDDPHHLSMADCAGKECGMGAIEYTLNTLPPLTKERRERLERLAAMPDNQINYDDIPRLTDAQLAELKRDAMRNTK